MHHSIYSRTNYRAPRILIAALAIGLAGPGQQARAVDFTVVAAALGAPNVGWELMDGNGEIMMPFDPPLSYPGHYVFDVGSTPWGAPLNPSGELLDNGDGTVTVTMTDAFGNSNTLYNASTLGSVIDWMRSLGFTVVSTGQTSSSGNVATSGTVTLAPTDSANLSLTAQVACWIFGAFLMLPIILKVRPT